MYIILDRTGRWPSLQPGANLLYQWGILLGAVVLVLGIVNVGWMHIQRTVSGKKHWAYSAALVAAMLATFIAGVLNPAGIHSPLVDWIFRAIIAPGQATLFSLLAFFMLSAAFLFLRADRRGGGWMLLGVLLMLAAQAPVASVWMAPGLAGVAKWMLDVPGMAAFRGVLLGSAMASILVSVRFVWKAR